MRLIDADVLEYHEIDEIGGEYNPYLGCSKEYIDRQPTVCDIGAIKAEIEAEKQGFPPSADYYKAISRALDIIDKYTKGVSK